MNKFLIYFIIFISIPNSVKSNISKFDIYKIKIGTSYYFMESASDLVLKNNDFCYYNYNNEYVMEVNQYIEKLLKSKNWFPLYSQLIAIDISKMKDIMGDEKVLYILKNEVKLDPKIVRSNFELIFVFTGNTGGNVYSEDLCQADNKWIKNNSIEKLFDFTDYEICNMALFTIKGSVTKKEVILLRNKIDKIIRNYKIDRFKQELKRLYNRKIIMFGTCYC